MVEKAPMAAVSLFGVLYDKERLERGQSTSNVATILATAVIEAGKQWVKPQPALDPITVDPAPCIDGEIISG
jgi:hypothetical protein